MTTPFYSPTNETVDFCWWCEGYTDSRNPADGIYTLPDGEVILHDRCFEGWKAESSQRILDGFKTRYLRTRSQRRALAEAEEAGEAWDYSHIDDEQVELLQELAEVLGWHAPEGGA